jgi:hypothetical protein
MEYSMLNWVAEVDNDAAVSSVQVLPFQVRRRF